MFKAWDRVNAKNKTATTIIVHTVDPAKSWSPEEQKLLEQGLRTFKGKDRWVKIAETIPGKTKDDCQARFNYLKEALKKKQAAATSTTTKK